MSSERCPSKTGCTSCQAPQPLINEHHSAQFLGCTIRCLQRWRVTGEGPRYVKVGRLVRYAPEELRRFVEEHTTRSTVEAESLR